MNRLWTFRLSAAGIPTVLGLVAIVFVLIEQERLVFEDGSIRLQSPPTYVQEPGHDRTGHKYLYDSELGWRNIANWEATTFGKKLTTNSKHLRDREYTYEKPEGWKRILVLGDSFTWGYGVANDDIFTEVLEERFENEGKQWEVLNAGVSGWGTDQEYLYYVRDGVKFTPDIVVLAFYIGNDPNNNVESIQYGLNKPLFTDMNLTVANVPVPKPLTDNTKIIRSTIHGLAISTKIMQELTKECNKTGAQLVIMKFGLFQMPNSKSARQTEATFHSLVPAITKLGGAHYLDLDAEFEKRSATVEQLTKGIADGHWNPYGHETVAEILHDFLQAQSLLK